MKAVMLVQTYKERDYPYDSFHVKLAQFIQNLYLNDESSEFVVWPIYIGYHRRYRRLRDILAFAMKLISLLPSLVKYDIIVSTHILNSMVISLLISIPCWLLRLKKPAHVILDVPLGRLLPPSEKGRLRLVRLSLLPVDRLITFSKTEHSYWEQHLGFGGRVCYVPLGVDTDSFQPGDKTGDYILSVGQRVTRDYETLFSAIGGLKIKLSLLARGFEWDKTSPKVEIPAKNVELVTPLEQSKYRDLLARSKFVVVPLKKTIGAIGGSVILEAMAAGKAVIATNTGGGAEYIVDGQTGLLVSPENVAELRQRIIFLLENPEEVKRIGRNARRAAETEFSMKMTTESIKQALEEVCLGKKKKG